MLMFLGINPGDSGVFLYQFQVSFCNFTYFQRHGVLVGLSPVSCKPSAQTLKHKAKQHMVRSPRPIPAPTLTQTPKFHLIPENRRLQHIVHIARYERRIHQHMTMQQMRHAKDEACELEQGYLCMEETSKWRPSKPTSSGL